MRYGIEVVPFGGLSDPKEVVKLARAAEDAGWEAIAIWDHMLFPSGAGDPWVTLSAVAAVTERLKLITSVAPVPRYRPHLLARTLAGLDLLSNGRVIFGAGIGQEWDFSPFGEPADNKTRAAMADEGLEVITRLWSGQEVTYSGEHYRLQGVTLAPTPVQKPRVPIWIGGDSRAALRRAAHWDGWTIGTIDEGGNVTYPPQKVAERVAYIRSQRDSDSPFDVAVDGISEASGHSLPSEYADAGSTWWLEALYLSRGSMEELLERIAAGPPS